MEGWVLCFIWFNLIDDELLDGCFIEDIEFLRRIFICLDIFKFEFLIDIGNILFWREELFW